MSFEILLNFETPERHKSWHFIHTSKRLIFLRYGIRNDNYWNGEVTKAHCKISKIAKISLLNIRCEWLRKILNCYTWWTTPFQNMKSIIIYKLLCFEYNILRCFEDVLIYRKYFGTLLFAFWKEIEIFLDLWEALPSRNLSSCTDGHVFWLIHYLL